MAMLKALIYILRLILLKLGYYNLKTSGQLKAERLFETENCDVVSTYIGMYKYKDTRSPQCDHLEPKLPGKETIIISKLDGPVGFIC